MTKIKSSFVKELTIFHLGLPLVGSIDVLFYLDGTIIVGDLKKRFKPTKGDYNYFHKIPQVCFYGLILKKYLPVNISIKCLMFNGKKSWFFSPDIILKNIPNAIKQGLKENSKLMDFDWFFILKHTNNLKTVFPKEGEIYAEFKKREKSYYLHTKIEKRRSYLKNGVLDALSNRPNLTTMEILNHFNGSITIDQLSNTLINLVNEKLIEINPKPKASSYNSYRISKESSKDMKLEYIPLEPIFYDFGPSTFNYRIIQIIRENPGITGIEISRTMDCVVRDNLLGLVRRFMLNRYKDTNKYGDEKIHGYTYRYFEERIRKDILYTIIKRRKKSLWYKGKN